MIESVEIVTGMGRRCDRIGWDKLKKMGQVISSEHILQLDELNYFLIRYLAAVSATSHSV
jgi:hypothetical protein